MFLQAHISIMEKGSENQQSLTMGLQFLVNISYVEADEVLKICLDYWNLFVPDVYTTSQTNDVNAQFSFGPMPTVCPSDTSTAPLSALLHNAYIAYNPAWKHIGGAYANLLS